MATSETLARPVVLPTSRWAARLLDWVVGLGVTGAAFALYHRTLLPTVGLGDTAEFQYAIATLSVPHPTSYPLYVLLGKLFTLLPFGNEAYRVNLFSATCAAGAAGLVVLLARLLGVRPFAAALGGLAFAVAPAPWSWATIAEVYALHVFLVGVVLVAFALWAVGRLPLTWAAFLLGLSFGNHRGMLLVVPALFALGWMARRPSWGDLRRQWRHALRVGLAFALPWLLYLYIPLRGIPGYQGWWEPLNYAATGSSLLAQIELMSRNPLASAQDYVFSLLPAQFGWLTPLAPLGLVLLAGGFPRGGRVPARFGALLLGGSWAGILAFHLPVYGGDITGFLTPTFWLLAVGLAVTVDALARGLARLLAWRVAPAQPLAALGVPLVLGWIGPWTVLVGAFSSQDLSGHTMHEQRATQLLEALEPNAVLVLNDDWLQIWQLKYQRYVAGVRPDTIVIDGPAEPLLRQTLAGGRPAYAMNYAPGLAAEGRLLPVLGFWRALEQPITYQVRQAAAVTFGDQVQLVGWSTLTETLQPGGLFPIELEWQALTDLTTDYVVFVHLLDEQGHSPAGWDSQPLHAEDPTSNWRRGELHRDPHGLLLPRSLRPGRYFVEVGLYPEGSTVRLPVTTPPGPPADRALLGPFRVAIPAPTTAPQVAAERSIGSVITFLGYDPPAPAAGQELALTLYWRAEQLMDRDYTVTVQLLDGGGHLVAQHDTQPMSGNYPTTIWRPGEVIRDTYRVPVAKLAPGEYRLIVALYDQAGKRLAVGQSDHLDLGMVRLP
ncbi:MAG: DUF2723 domain-containing protein [Chloroflexi bacterium]|nr:DUF2723 domain-containing protein [Chloroflexota bacterium]